MVTIKRDPIRDQVYQLLLDELLHNRIEPGIKLQETELAEHYEISRTPVREGLIKLEQEGYVENLHGKGFVVRPFSIEDATELYPILACLETLAVEETPSIKEVQLDELNQLNFQLLDKNRSVDERLHIDLEWHNKLTAGCSNTQLMRFIERVRRKVHRYEFAYMRNSENLNQSVRDHSKLLSVLKLGQFPNIGELLREHWMNSLVILEKAIQETASTTNT